MWLTQTEMNNFKSQDLILQKNKFKQMLSDADGFYSRNYVIIFFRLIFKMKESETFYGEKYL